MWPVTVVANRRGSIEMLADLFAEVMFDVITTRTLADAGAYLTVSQLECLKYLQRHGSCSAAELADGLHMTPPAVTKLVDRLVRKGLVTRKERADDRRSVEIALTDSGRRAVERIRERRSRIFEMILSRMSPEDQQQLEHALRAFLAAGLNDTAVVEALCLRCGDESTPDCPLIEAYRDLTGTPLQCR
ncbi:MAG: MarR family transcriptional regulator [Limnochordaceae bacterium]|uniref:MarR family transcriptional regulator n=1 Tax=Carboxydichorda subterranea TaxID=3109565 RepID=A0ABZ1BYX8_9FIRM|nr:MarR family transcriptional regulator [Limnochorda sp. L945t]MBE3598941.1 MarR family transcriptional regulator [Limnochordaceae bacterium]WRP17805.1 MarR family transcriptional regulator [Limnochorda sp. L945t]